MPPPPEFGDLHEVVHRGRDRTWVQEATAKRRRWIRRRVWWAGTAIVAVMVTAFLMDGGPRWSGLLDAVGATHCEFLQVVAPQGQPPVWSSWAEFTERDDSGADPRAGSGSGAGSGSTEGAGTSAEELDAVAGIAEASGLSPSLAASRPEALTQRRFTVRALGEQLVVAHHDESWTGTDRVHVVNPVSGEVSWAAELTHPVRNPDHADDPRRRVLLGAGVIDDTVVLQTPTHDGTGTDVALAPLNEQGVAECVRLGPPAQTSELLQDVESAWVQVINLNQWWDGEDQVLVLHGDPDHEISPGETELGTWVNLTTAETDGTETFDVSSGYPDFVTGATEAETILQDPVLGEYQLEPVGERSYLLTWGKGYVVLQD